MTKIDNSALICPCINLHLYYCIHFPISFSIFLNLFIGMLIYHSATVICLFIYLWFWQVHSSIDQGHRMKFNICLPINQKSL